VHKQIY